MRPEVSTRELPRSVSTERPVVAARVPPVAAGRNTALDFVKGTLVLFMVLYHSFNYFHHDKDILKYLHFLPSSFIFITGFLITNVYLAKYDANDLRLLKRLAIRGFKLFLIFVALNLAAHSLVHSNYNKRQMGLEFLADNLDTVFLSGDGKVAVFDVLLPISYLLLVSGILLQACGRARRLLPLTGLAVVGVCCYLSFWGHLAFNLELLSMGLLGLAAGMISLARVESVARHPVWLAVWYIGYLAVITQWYPIYTLNIAGVSLTLLLLYGAGLKLGTGPVWDRIIRLGQYSLVGYIIQIGILQVLFAGLRRFESTEIKLAIGLTVTPLLTIGIIEATEFARRKSALANRAYQSVFA